MKIATVIKTWYTHTNIWCNLEFFTVILLESKDNEIIKNHFYFQWLYWTETRVESLLKEKWYENFYTYWNYWKIKKKDIYKNTLSETEVIEFINNL